MKYCYFCWVLSLVTASSLLGGSIPVINRAGEAHVSAARLEEAGIAIKSLPGQKQLVACFGERCALVKDFIDDGSELLVRIESLAKALGAKPRFDEMQRNVSFEFSPENTTATSGTARLGQLAPDFRLRKLDGSSVALSDFRGKRVLINSWASW